VDIEYQMGPIRDENTVIRVQALLLNGFELSKERRNMDHCACPDEIETFRVDEA
jgi:hypothetical protein